MKEYPFSISKKVWLSLSILIFGYMASIVYGYISGSREEADLARLSESVFPAAMESKAALNSFNDMVEFYQDAIGYGEEEHLESAAAKANEARLALERLVRLTQHDRFQSMTIREILDRLNLYIKESGQLYSKMLQDMENEELTGQAKSMIRQSESLRSRLTVLAQSLSRLMKSRLEEVAETSRGQRHANMIVFILVVIISFILVSIILKRAVTGPLEKAAALAGGYG